MFTIKVYRRYRYKYYKILEKDVPFLKSFFFLPTEKSEEAVNLHS